MNELTDEELSDILLNLDKLETLANENIKASDDLFSNIYSNETLFERSPPKDFNNNFYPSAKTAEAGHGIPKNSPAGKKIAAVTIEKNNAKTIKNEVRNIRSGIRKKTPTNINNLYDWLTKAKAVSLQANLALHSSDDLFEDDFDLGEPLNLASLHANVFNNKKTQTQDINLNLK